MKTNNVACFTLDLEADYAGVPPEETYQSLEQTSEFERMVSEEGLKLTTFVTGYILERDFPIIGRLKALGSRFETHTYSHPLRRPPEEKIRDIRRGIEAYAKYFGERPHGYRAPQGIISMEEVKCLADERLSYSSSIFPAWLPTRYNNLHFPTAPFIYRDAPLLEIPMSVVPAARLPITASHLNLLTYGVYGALMAVLGTPSLLNICMHLYDFADIPAYRALPVKEKIGYWRTRRLHDKTVEIRKLARRLRAVGYEFCYLTDAALAILKSGETPCWQGDMGSSIEKPE